MAKRIVIVGAGVAGVNAATKLVDNGYDGSLITIIDMGKDPYNRKPEEVMTGFLGAGGWSDGKLTYHTAIGGQLSKYTGEEKAMELMNQVITNFKRFHPKPEEVQCSNPIAEPDFIKPYFGLRLFPVWHVGTDYLSEIAKNWYDYLVSKGVKFIWKSKVTSIDFDINELKYEGPPINEVVKVLSYDELIFAVGKSGIDFAQQIQDDYKLETEQKSVQLGVRFEAPQHHFQKLINISYDFKLYRKFDDKGVSLRSFCLPGTESIHIERDGIKLFTTIDEISQDDKILTYDFNKECTKFIKPKTLFNREYKGNLITINNKLTTTEEHIYFVWEKEKIKSEHNRKDGYKDDVSKLNKIVEKSAKCLVIGDRLVTPKNFPKLNQLKSTTYTNEQLWMFGLWFADGSGNYKSKWDSNGFSLTNEDYILDKIIDVLSKHNETYSSKKQYDNYSVLNFSSKILKKFLVNEECFKKGKERGLPKNIFNWSEEEIYSFLSGLIDGDGRVKKEYNICLDYFTVSDLLYRDLTYLFNYLGILYKSRLRTQSTNFKEDSQINIINISQRDSMLLLSNKLKLQNKNKNKLLQENINIDFQDRDNKNYEKVNNTQSEYYEGIVYDFEIEDTHTFIAGNTPIIIHNCTNNNAAYVAVEETYGDITYNGHAKKDPKYLNGMTNFGIIMEIKDIDNPFEWSRKVVNELQFAGTGLYYSPSRKPSTTSEGEKVSSIQIDSLDIVRHGMGEYWNYIEDFIEDMKKVFPTLGDDWGVYVPEVKYLSPEPLVYPKDLALVDFPNVHFVGDALSARGITVSGAQGILSVEKFITEDEWDNIHGDTTYWN